MYKFVSVLAGDTPKECATFREAFTHMFNWVNDKLNNGGLTHQVLETAIWIEVPSGAPLFFFDARDLAIDTGIMEDGGGLIPV